MSVTKNNVLIRTSSPILHNIIIIAFVLAAQSPLYLLSEYTEPIKTHG